LQDNILPSELIAPILDVYQGLQPCRRTKGRDIRRIPEHVDKLLILLFHLILNTMRIIVSNYSGYYESIHTEDSLCLLTIKIKYLFKGYKVHTTPLWYAKLIKKVFNKNVFKCANVSFEKFDPSKDQVTWHMPWDNFH
jgi:hypothetical protein